MSPGERLAAPPFQFVERNPVERFGRQVCIGDESKAIGLLVNVLLGRRRWQNVTMPVGCLRRRWCLPGTMVVIDGDSGCVIAKLIATALSSLPVGTGGDRFRTHSSSRFLAH